MADILIKNMEMPKSCAECPMQYVGEERTACFLMNCYNKIFIEKRPSWCPLVELPPHGRLTDADALSNRLLGEGIGNLLIHRKQRLTVGDVRTILENAPTIVEASNGSDN